MKRWHLLAALVFIVMVTGYALAQETDDDGDGILNEVDNCVTVPNADQLDTNADHFGNACDADLNNDCTVNRLDIDDLTLALASAPGDAHWNPHADLNGDNTVNNADLGIMQSQLDRAPGPGLYACRSAPNILLVISDDLGLDASGQYAVGSRAPTTPTLDTLAQNGLVFDNVWVNPVCSPTRATILTGRYGVRTGVLTPGDVLSTSEIALQPYIAANAPAAYRDAVIGKWHLGGRNADHPNLMGVTHFEGILRGGVQDYFNWTLVENGQGSEQTRYVTSELTDRAIAWVANQTAPWFLWLAYNAPHTPLHAPPDDLVSEPPGPNGLDQYLAMIEAMDTELGRLLAALPEEERAHTTIIYLGDNGTAGRVAQTYPRNRAKGSIYQGGIAVPMTITGYGVARRGERESALVNGTDLFATIANLAGAPTVAINDSLNFSELLTQDTDGPRIHAYSESVRDAAWAVRNAQYKLIVFDDGSRALYDLTLDSLETTNLLRTAPNDPAVMAAVDELEAVGNAIRQ